MATSGFSEGVEVKESSIAGAGRGLFATKDFSPGDVVFSADRPLVAELNAERMLDTCGWCTQRAATDPMERTASAAMGLPTGLIEVKSCVGCKRVAYCSKKCQSKAWKSEHKYECKAIRPDDRDQLSAHVRAVIKMLGRLQAEYETEIFTISEIMKFLPARDKGFTEEYKKQDEERYKELYLLGNGAWVFSDKPKIRDFNSRAISFTVLITIFFNAFDIGSPLDDMTVGFGFDPTVCSANNSCEPNVTLVHLQPRIELRALEPIKAGQEILMKYTQSTNPFTVRQADLKARYLFDCKCSKCKMGTSPDQLLHPQDKLRGIYLKTAEKLVEQHRSNIAKHLMPGGDEELQTQLAGIQAAAYAVLEDHHASADDLKEMLQLCLGSGKWAWTRQPVPALCRRLFEKYMHSGDLYRAFRIGLKLHLEIMPELYPQPFHHDRIILAWTISYLTNVLSSPAMSEIYKSFLQSGLEIRLIYYGFLLYAYENTPFMFGYDSPVGRVIKYTYEQIMASTTASRADIEASLVNVWPSLETLARNVDVETM
ncbi:SET domain-containing protein [Xylariaceae sp. FL1019]|nr:SET domain-containing protein [Xylariaceae sp. FL1019]